MEILGGKKPLQLSITWAYKLVYSHYLLLSYKQAKTLEDFNFPAFGFVMDLLLLMYLSTSKGMASWRNVHEEAELTFSKQAVAGHFYSA